MGLLSLLYALTCIDKKCTNQSRGTVELKQLQQKNSNSTCTLRFKTHKARWISSLLHGQQSSFVMASASTN